MKHDPTSTPTARLIISAFKHSQEQALRYAELAELTGSCLGGIKKTVRKLEAAGLVRRLVIHGYAYVVVPGVEHQRVIDGQTYRWLDARDLVGPATVKQPEAAL